LFGRNSVQSCARSITSEAPPCQLRETQLRWHQQCHRAKRLRRNSASSPPREAPGGGGVPNAGAYLCALVPLAVMRRCGPASGPDPGMRRSAPAPPLASRRSRCWCCCSSSSVGVGSCCLWAKLPAPSPSLGESVGSVCNAAADGGSTSQPLTLWALSAATAAAETAPLPPLGRVYRVLAYSCKHRHNKNEQMLSVPRNWGQIKQMKVEVANAAPSRTMNSTTDAAADTMKMACCHRCRKLKSMLPMARMRFSLQQQKQEQSRDNCDSRCNGESPSIAHELSQLHRHPRANAPACLRDRHPHLQHLGDEVGAHHLGQQQHDAVARQSL